ncbi:hypothetical protein B9L20_19215 [Serratia marcescens]|nr:hypothetical protein AN701_0216770 [Serratia marcescens]OCN29034.1 hypothetical protein AN699_0207960 [Serratia marcescens]OCN49230.1 hypothetical protein AN658_0209040 [Serratia marcescens]OCN49500.1 hypothetical protein AN660_0209210 [Serratia marcescens]OCN67596.1 hypothetical protein AN664_0210640 [Serratia marcescens]
MGDEKLLNKWSGKVKYQSIQRLKGIAPSCFLVNFIVSHSAHAIRRMDLLTMGAFNINFPILLRLH